MTATPDADEQEQLDEELAALLDRFVTRRLRDFSTYAEAVEAAIDAFDFAADIAKAAARVVAEDLDAE